MKAGDSEWSEGKAVKQEPGKGTVERKSFLEYSYWRYQSRFLCWRNLSSKKGGIHDAQERTHLWRSKVLRKAGEEIIINFPQRATLSGSWGKMKRKGRLVNQGTAYAKTWDRKEPVTFEEAPVVGQDEGGRQEEAAGNSVGWGCQPPWEKSRHLFWEGLCSLGGLCSCATGRRNANMYKTDNHVHFPACVNTPHRL